MLAVPVTVEPCGPIRSTVDPHKRPARATTRPDSTDKSAPSAANPARCKLIGLFPIRQPPGSGTTARPRRANSGPSTQKLARIARAKRTGTSTGPPSRTESAKALWPETGLQSAARYQGEISAPRHSSTRNITSTSPSRGMRQSSTGASANNDAARIGNAAFFEPAAGTLPARAAGPSILKQSIAHPCLARRGGCQRAPPTPPGPQSLVRGRPNP